MFDFHHGEGEFQHRQFRALVFSGSTNRLAAVSVVQMANEEPFSQLYPEQLVAENVSEAVWLRFRRLTSATLCSRVVATRAPSLKKELVEQKGREIASSVRGALGYWDSTTTSLNAKALTRYYALLQISIAEQLASPASIPNLSEVQRYTESGHGLWAISSPGKEFPSGYMVACRTRGHFHEYCRFKGIDLAAYASKARPDSWDELSTDEQARLVSLGDLFRRIPELQPIIGEALGIEPLSFHVGQSMLKDMAGLERMQEHPQETGEMLFAPPVTGPSTITCIGIYPHGQRLSADNLNSFGLPIKNIRPAKDEVSGSEYFVGDLTHPSDKVWFQCLETYKSGYCGTSVIVPFWGGITDPFIIHLVTLYALSIVVRYLPSLWHEIENGKLDHVRALIEHYLAIVDNVLPQIAIERITGRRLIAVQPGSLLGPV